MYRGFMLLMLFYSLVYGQVEIRVSELSGRQIRPLLG